MHRHRHRLQLLLLLHLLPPLPAAVGASPCNRTCGGSTVQYPFGFSSSCPIQLSCATNGTFFLPYSSYAVSQIVHNGTLVVSVSPDCSRSSAVAGILFGDNYAPSWRTVLFMRNCSTAASYNRTSSGSGNSTCILSTSIIAGLASNTHDVSNCSNDGGNLSCAPTNGWKEAIQSPMKIENMNCTGLFTSVTYYGDAGNESLAVAHPVLALWTAELAWWLNGTACECDANAKCYNARLPEKEGYWCVCNDGFDGDGFAAGEGCKEVSSRHWKEGFLVGGIVGAAALVALIAVFLVVRRRQRANKHAAQQVVRRLLSDSIGPHSVRLHSYRDVVRATNSFSNSHCLGTGAYGTVYIGKLGIDELVAIKRMRHPDATDLAAITNEIKLLSSVNHRNLVRLLGCCLEHGEQILIYEFVPNGCLSNHLRRGVASSLSWPTRLTIATETADAIAYLHNALQPPIYHRDIKSSNILLDEKLRPKVADFGLSRFGAGWADGSHISTAPQGTPGYVDPEYNQNFHLSDKSDVYSFGVVLLEIVTAMRAVDFSRAPGEVSLASLAIDRIGKGRIEEIIDPSLIGKGEESVMESVRKVVEVAFRCLAFQKDLRPTMTEVAMELQQIQASSTTLGQILNGREELDYSKGILELNSITNGRQDRSRSRLSRNSPVSVQEDLYAGEQSSGSTNGSVIHSK